MSTKKTIGIDFDDVIFNLSDNVLAFFNNRFNTKFKRSDITTYYMGVLWGLNREEEMAVFKDFYFSEMHHKGLPMDGAIEGIKELSKYHTLIMVTAREDALQEVTQKWLDKYLLNVFSKVVFANNNHKDINKRKKKSEICLELGIDVFIDDSLENVRDISRVVKQVILLDAPWNQGEIPENVFRMILWKDIVDGLKV